MFWFYFVILFVTVAFAYAALKLAITMSLPACIFCVLVVIAEEFVMITMLTYVQSIPIVISIILSVFIPAAIGLNFAKHILQKKL